MKIPVQAILHGALALFTLALSSLHGDEASIRGGAAKVYPLLSPKELAALLPDIVEAVTAPLPVRSMGEFIRNPRVAE